YCAGQGLPSQVAVEELMACGMGVCWTCAVPVIRPGGKSWDNLRACVEGPVFSGARVWWDRWLGSPAAPMEAVHTPPHGFQMEQAAAGRGEPWNGD
ncbi:MAG: hypothetical protein M3245_05685, partial [Actinomycetota bacterium]|nr:hypothetical protein [Actinomycetota bacterium]